MSKLVDEKVRAYKMDWSLPNGFDKEILKKKHMMI